MTHDTASALPIYDSHMRNLPAILLAGGKGTRLHELIGNKCKPALQFGDQARIVDFSLGNARNSGIRNIIAATQYQPHTLHRHLSGLWDPVFRARGGGVKICYGPQITRTTEGYSGTANAVTANIPDIDSMAPEHVLILAADHVYRMDYRRMLETHCASGVDLTIAAARVPLSRASAFGIIGADEAGRVMEFVEKPASPPAMRHSPQNALASMGIYIFRWSALRAALLADQANEASTHDFGHDIVPQFVRDGRAVVHAYASPVPDTKAYWRDVGTLDSFRQAHLDLIRRADEWARLARAWPILPAESPPGPRDLEKKPRGVDCSFVATHGYTGRGARIVRSVVMSGAGVGRRSRLTDCILMPGAVVPAGTVIGEDPGEDSRWFRRTEHGTLLVTPPALERQAQWRATRSPGHVTYRRQKALSGTYWANPTAGNSPSKGRD